MKWNRSSSPFESIMCGCFFFQRQSQHPGTNPLISFCSCSWWTCWWSFFCFHTHGFSCVRSRLKDWCFGRSSWGCWKMSLTSNLVSPNAVTWHDWYCGYDNYSILCKFLTPSKGAWFLPDFSTNQFDMSIDFRCFVEACFLLWRTCCWKAQWHMCHRRWGAVNNPDWDWVLVTESMVDGWNVYFNIFYRFLPMALCIPDWSNSTRS